MIPAHLPPPVPREGAKPGGTPLTGADAAGEGSFADVLASLAAAGAVRPSFLGQEPVQGVAREEAPVQAAEIFNEHGVVGSLVTGPDATAFPVQLQEAAAVASRVLAAEAPARPVAAAAARLARPVTGSAAEMLAAAPASAGFAAEPLTVSPQVAAGHARAMATRTMGHGNLLAAGAPRSAGLPVRQAQAKPAEAASARFETRLRQKLAALLEQHLGAENAHELSVGVLAAEEGLRVSVRAERLSREQKERLRADIAELLSSHGLSASDIMLNGEAAHGGRGRRG
jgi:hypothetical protein